MDSSSTGGVEARPHIAPARRPTLLIVRDAQGLDPTAALTESVGDLAFVFTFGWSGAATPSALADLIAKHLPDRELVVFAEGALARAALATEAANVRRVVAIDPPDDAVVARRPVDVVLRRPGARAPALGSVAGVKLHRTWPNVSLYADDLERLTAEVVREACRRAAPNSAPAAMVLDAALLEATPLAAGALGYLGPEADAFGAAYLSRRPGARVMDVAAGAAEPLDVLVLGQALALDRLEALTQRLKPGGWLVARWCAADAIPVDLAGALERAGLRLAAPVDLGGTGVFRARREDQARPAPLSVVYSAFSPTLMDIRTRLPVQQMGSDPDLAVHHLVPLRSIPPLAVDSPKIVVMQRPGRVGVESWRFTTSRFVAKGWVCAFEYDDHPHLIAHAAGREPTEEMMQRFSYLHAVQTSVEPLAEVFRLYNPEVRVFPNAAFELLPFPQKIGPRRVFYGATPRGDLPIAVAKSLRSAIERFPDIEFVVVGSRAVFDALPTPRKALHPYMAYDSYLDLMATCTVSLSPIDGLRMRDMKSDAKFVDASRAGVLTIASPTIYARTIRHGENGQIAREVEDWPRLLIDAFADPEATRRMARTAWEEVRDGRMFADQIADRKAWYQSLWDRREALTEALMERLPGLREEVALLRGG